MAQVPSSGQLAAGSGFIEGLKKTYAKVDIKANFELETPFMKSVKKVSIGEGQNYTWWVPLAAPSNYANDLDTLTARSTLTGATQANFVANTGDDYAILSLSNKFLARSKKADASFVEQLKFSIETNLQGYGVQVARKMAQDGSGAIAKLGTTFTGTAGTCTLLYPEDAKYFAPGMVCKGATESGGVPTTTLSAEFTILTVNEATGVITWTSAAMGGDVYTYIGLSGSIGQTTNAVGLAGWIPLTVAAGVGVVSTTITCSHARTAAPERLAGWRLTGETAKPLDELIFKLVSKMQQRGSKPDRVLMSFNTYNKVASRQWNRIVPANQAEAGKLAADGFVIKTGAGNLPLMADSTIHDDRVYLLKGDTWRIAHLSAGMPEKITEASGDGGFFQLSSDGIQIRYRAWWNLICLDPFQNGVIQVDSTAF